MRRKRATSDGQPRTLTGWADRAVRGLPAGLRPTATADRPTDVRVVCQCGRRLAALPLAEVGTLRQVAARYGRDWPCDRCAAVWPVDGKAFGLALVRARRTGVVRLPLA